MRGARGLGTGVWMMGCLDKPRGTVGWSDAERELHSARCGLRRVRERGGDDREAFDRMSRAYGRVRDGVERRG